MAAKELIEVNTERPTSNTKRRSRSALETSPSTTPRSPRLNASPARTTKKTKVDCETRVASCLLLKFLRIRSKNFRYLLDRVPIARGDRHTQLLLDLAEIADCFHL